MRRFDAAVGLALRVLREEKRWAIGDLVEKTGIPGSEIEAYEAGATIPKSDLHAMLWGLNIDRRNFWLRVDPRQTDGEVSKATPEEGCELVRHFQAIPNEIDRQFLIDMAHALSMNDFMAD